MNEDETVVLSDEDKQKILPGQDEDITQTDFGTDENDDDQ